MSEAPPPTRPRLLLPTQLALAVPLAMAGFAWLGMEILWVIGGIAAGWVACRLFQRRGHETPPGPSVRRLGQVLVGAALGPTLAVQHFEGSWGQIPIVLASLLAVLAGTVLISYVYARWAGIDQVTSGLSTLPGGMVILPVVAAEMNRPAQLVAVVQATRMSLVVCAVAALAPGLGEVASHPVSAVAETPDHALGWGYWAALLAGAFLAAWCANRLRVPVAYLLGPMFFSFALTLLLRGAGVHTGLLEVPHSQEILGQLLLGVTVGEYLAQRTRIAPGTLARGFASVIATLALALLVAVAMTPFTPWSFMTSLLIVAPGGAPEMVVVASAVDAELHVVVLAQTIRQVAINALMPLWVKLFQRLSGT